MFRHFQSWIHSFDRPVSKARRRKSQSDLGSGRPAEIEFLESRQLLSASVVTAIPAAAMNAGNPVITPSAQPAWDIRGQYSEVTVNSSGSKYFNTLSFDQMNPSTGFVSGLVLGSTDVPNGILSGNVAGSSVSLYYQAMNSTYKQTFTGTIAADGSISGSYVDSNHATGTWQTTAGNAVYGQPLAPVFSVTGRFAEETIESNSTVFQNAFTIDSMDPSTGFLSGSFAGVNHSGTGTLTGTVIGSNVTLYLSTLGGTFFATYKGTISATDGSISGTYVDYSDSKPVSNGTWHTAPETAVPMIASAPPLWNVVGQYTYHSTTFGTSGTATEIFNITSMDTSTGFFSGTFYGVSGTGGVIMNNTDTGVLWGTVSGSSITWTQRYDFGLQHDTVVGAIASDGSMSGIGVDLRHLGDTWSTLAGKASPINSVTNGTSVIAAGFTFQVQDNKGTANGGHATDPTARSLIVADKSNNAVAGTPNPAALESTVNSTTGVNADLVGKWFYGNMALAEKAYAQS